MIKKRAVVFVIDSLGIGSMDDYAEYRQSDKDADTFRHILDCAKYISIPNLERLGINNILRHPRLSGSKEVIGGYGAMRLAHTGADSYMGHQEIMGSKPIAPLNIPFKEAIDDVEAAVIASGYGVRRINGGKPCLLVNNLIVIGDNIETDYGQIYNITAPLDYVKFSEVLKIGKIVRSAVKVSRVIALGGKNIGAPDIIQAIETTDDGAAGVNCPKSGVYKNGYQVCHLGYGINPEKQLSSILVSEGIDVTLIGKMSDVIDCDGAVHISAVETDRVMCESVHAFQNTEKGLIMATVQETDLSGHCRDADRYAAKISTVDHYLSEIINGMTDNDLLIITADHGNDPTIGHSHHTREKVFLLCYMKNRKTEYLGERETLSDVAATVCEFFGVPKCENGSSFIRFGS